MLIAIHSLTGEKITLETGDLKTTVADVKQYVLTLWSVPIPAQILVCNGRVLSPETKPLSSTEFYNDAIDVVLILSVKHLKHRLGGPCSVTIANRMEMLLARRELRRHTDGRFLNQRLSQIAAATAMDNADQGNGAVRASPIMSRAGANLFSTLATAVNPDPNKMQQLRDMGFPEDQCRRVLLQHYNNLEMALNWLLMHSSSGQNANEDNVSDS